MKKAPEEIIAKDKAEWWKLIREDLRKWNSSNHPDDNMGLADWIGEQKIGRFSKVFGWIPFRDEYGDWDISLSGFADDLDDEDKD